MNIRIGDQGFTFEDLIVDENLVPVNISSATAINYKFEDPNGVETVCAGTFSTTGIDGLVKYTVANSVLFAISGVWQYQVNVITPTRNWNSCIVSFFVEDLI